MSADTILFLLLTSLGSGLGGMGRYGLSLAVAQRTEEHFPLGTLVVNVSGAFAIGVVWVLLLQAEESSAVQTVLRDFVMFGVLGGYTTVSSWSLNTLELLQQGRSGLALLNVAGSVGACLAAVFAGAALAGLIL